MSSIGSTQSRFRRVFRGEFEFVTGLARRLGVRASDTEDVAHEVFVVFFRRIREYDKTRPVRPWLFGIAVRVASDYRRLARNARELPFGACDDAITSARRDAPDAQVLDGEILRSLEAIPLERRAVLVMHDLLGYSMPEIARELEIPLNTGYTRLRLARDAVQSLAVKWN